MKIYDLSLKIGHIYTSFWSKNAEKSFRISEKRACHKIRRLARAEVNNTIRDANLHSFGLNGIKIKGETVWRGEKSSLFGNDVVPQFSDASEVCYEQLVSGTQQ